MNELSSDCTEEYFEHLPLIECGSNHTDLTPEMAGLEVNYSNNCQSCIKYEHYISKIRESYERYLDIMGEQMLWSQDPAFLKGRENLRKEMDLILQSESGQWTFTLSK